MPFTTQLRTTTRNVISAYVVAPRCFGSCLRCLTRLELRAGVLLTRASRSRRTPSRMARGSRGYRCPPTGRFGPSSTLRCPVQLKVTAGDWICRLPRPRFQRITEQGNHDQLVTVSIERLRATSRFNAVSDRSKRTSFSGAGESAPEDLNQVNGLPKAI